jgi:hypothetical protein
MGRSWNSYTRKPFQVYDKEHIRMTRDNTAQILEGVITAPYEDIRKLALDDSNPGLVYIAACALRGDARSGKFNSTQKILDRILGKANQPITVHDAASNVRDDLTFEEFVANAKYPTPYPLQIQMMEFGIFEPGHRLLLGTRGYGKTDYVTGLGIAYDLYLDYHVAVKEKRAPELTWLLITKSDSRNAAIINEIAKALAANGVPMEKQNASELRVKGVHGKDPSLGALTIGSTSFRGRHPKKAVMDDPVTPEDVSEATRKKAERVYNELTKLTENILIIGQPVHKFDLYESKRSLLKKMEVTYGMIPELDADLEAQRLAGVSEESIQASYYLKVISENGNPLENVQFIDTFPTNDTAVAFIDPSFKGGDFTAMTSGKQYFNGVAVKGRVWKRAWYNCIDDFVAEIKENNVKRICFETNCLGDQPVILLRDALSGMGVGVVGKDSKGHKHSRISALGPFAKSIHIAKTSDKKYIEHTIKYEYGVEPDDAPDSLAGLLEWIGLIRGQGK